ncbi:MAG: DUF547 domain-containing protein, partial [Phycisphaerae bacterium]
RRCDMRRRTKITLGVVLAIVVLAGAGAYVAHREFVGADTFDEEFYAGGGNHNSEFTYDSYAAVLNEHVDEHGMVSYAALKDDPDKLHHFVRAMAAVEPETYRSWDEPTKIAFWINAYNALTLKAIIDHYPIKAGLLSGLAYPSNSIRQIPGVWDKLQFLVIGEKLTLDEIEHAILRGERDKALSEKYGRFNEPRIHVALVCAAKGCPQLRNEPFAGERLDEQLNDQTRGFLAKPDKFRIDLPAGQAGRDAGKVHLSSIFKWFGEDFVQTYKPEDGFASGRNDAEKAVLNFIAGYLGEEDAEYLRTGDYTVEYLDYDWSLNEQDDGE